jgi:hypothetical protein
MNIGLRALSLVLLPLAGAMIWAYRALRWDADRLHGALTALRQAFPARPGAAPATDQPADDREQMRLAAREALRALQRDMIPEGRRGYIQDVGGFSIFVDDDYAEVIRRSSCRDPTNGRNANW